MSDAKPYRATEPKSLEELIMSPTVPKNEAEWWASREIESLRQRVKELEKYQREAIHLRNVMSLLDDELSALKAGQESPNLPLGEPVAWTRVERDCCDEYFNAIVWAVDTNGKPPDGDKIWVPLYITPTIPEGWQLVPVEPTEEMIDALALAKNSTMQGYKSLLTDTEFRNMAKAMLAATPKPEESLSPNVDSAFVSLVDDPEGCN